MNAMAFVMPGSCENILLQTIGQMVEINLTIYGYSKLVIVAYKYSQKFIIKDKIIILFSNLGHKSDVRLFLKKNAYRVKSSG